MRVCVRVCVRVDTIQLLQIIPTMGIPKMTPSSNIDAKAKKVSTITIHVSIYLYIMI